MPKGEHEKAKTKCPRGHEYNEENTRFNGDGSRHCRTCDREKKKRERRADGRVVVPFGERTHCPRGHAYDEANTRHTKQGRACRACDLAKQLARAKAGPELIMWRLARNRAREKGLDFNIDVGDIVVPEKCPALGIPIIRNEGVLGAGMNSPSLDRLDSSKGYIKGNVSVISWRANRIKCDGTAEEHEKIAAWMRSTGAT